MLVSAAVCPHPPALVPSVSQGSAAVLADVRQASVAAVRRLRDADPDRLVCIGAGETTQRWPGDAGGSLRAFGIDTAFGGPEHCLPLSLTIAAYVLSLAGQTGCDEFCVVARDAAPQACADLGAEIAGSAARVALLVMADGSAKRSRQAPGYVDERAEDFDNGVVEALGAADPERLLAISPERSDELWAAGRPAWQVLAGALRASPGLTRGTVDYVGAPLGVGYAVVSLG